jgi:serine/threonine-protein kinase RsbW
MADAWEPFEIRLRIPSRMEWLGLVDRVASGIAEQLDFEEEAADAVANSVVEAGTNAIQHGHRYASALPVDLVFEVQADRLTVRVHDRGPGFDVAKVLLADPTAPGSLLCSRGRGIFIMKSLMDRVEFEISAGMGCTAVLTKYRRASG